MNSIHQNLALSLFEALDFSKRCVAEVESYEEAVVYNDVLLAISSLIDRVVSMGGEV
jgi:hypothetical protein